MKYLLDTNIISELLRPRPSTLLVQHMQTVPPEELTINSIVLGELLYGALRKAQQKNLQLIDNFATRVTILPFDEQAARRYSQIRVYLEQKGQIIGDADIRIGRIALSNNLILVTRNVRPFSLIPLLTVENWIDN
jgi:tRNA(fMet)-specific endonuclease VapC